MMTFTWWDTVNRESYSTFLAFRSIFILERRSKPLNGAEESVVSTGHTDSEVGGRRPWLVGAAEEKVKSKHPSLKLL